MDGHHARNNSGKQRCKVDDCHLTHHNTSITDDDNGKTIEGLAVASTARDDPSTLPGNDPFPRARMHRDRNAR